VQVAPQPVMAAAAPAEILDSPAIPGRFYSPLVKNIAKAENISTAELERIPGTGQQGRVTKQDILAYVGSRSSVGSQQVLSRPIEMGASSPAPAQPSVQQVAAKPAVSVSGGTEIIEMDRMRKLIADHMVMSKHTSPHVTSFVEVDVTEIVNWRERNKGIFEKKYGEKITFTPIFLEAVARAIGDFPMINVSVDGNRIIVKKDINIGMATALPSGNLIVPVIKNANTMNLVGLTKAVNDLAGRARQGKLKPDEIQDGTFTLTNVGTFGNVMGTPIINQPQVAIMAVGAIRKKPAVVETAYGDLIAIRQMMFLSMSYDHRVVDGSLGGSFIRRVGDYLEKFDGKREV
jgi:2-oxoglutarate dehydrogenase E2 component (dihydrolipoamide succinyltransferase)